jgi:hypothetical protein
VVDRAATQEAKEDTRPAKAAAREAAPGKEAKAAAREAETHPGEVPVKEAAKAATPAAVAVG